MSDRKSMAIGPWSPNAAGNEEYKLRQEIATFTAELARVKAELSRWQLPFDQERLEAAKQQASRQDSLAAMQVYIIALEHGIKAIKAERDALQQAFDRLMKERDAQERAIEKAQAERDAALKDAERYRFLRDKGQASFQLKVNTPHNEGVYEHTLFGPMAAKHFDAAIDAAREG